MGAQASPGRAAQASARNVRDRSRGDRDHRTAPAPATRAPPGASARAPPSKERMRRGSPSPGPLSMNGEAATDSSVEASSGRQAVRVIRRCPQQGQVSGTHEAVAVSRGCSLGGGSQCPVDPHRAGRGVSPTSEHGGAEGRGHNRESLVPTRRSNGAPESHGETTTGTRRGGPTATGDEPGSKATEAAAREGPVNAEQLGHLSSWEKVQHEDATISEAGARSGGVSALRSRGVYGAARKASVARANRLQLSCQGRTARLTNDPER